jgi:hypothetical protein
VATGLDVSQYAKLFNELHGPSGSFVNRLLAATGGLDSPTATALDKEIQQRVRSISPYSITSITV